jgi:hypothetical protein
MFEEMKIGVSLLLKGDAAMKLKSFHELVKKLTKNTELLEQKLRVVANNIERMNVHLERVNPRMREFFESAGASQKTMGALNTTLTKSNTSLTGLNTRLTSAVTGMDRLTRSASEAKAAMAGLGEGAAAAKMAGIPAAGGGGRRGGRGGIHVHPLSFAGLGFSGPAMAVGGAALLGYTSYHHGADYQQTLAQLGAMNLPGGTMQAADAFVTSHRMRGISPNAMAQALTDSAVITRDYKHAEQIAPFIAKMRYGAEGVIGHRFSPAQEQAALKVAELATGSKDPEVLRDYIDHMFKVGVGTGFRVMPTDFWAMVRGARGALTGTTQFDGKVKSNFSPDMMFYGLESLIQESGGPSVGRQIGQFYNHILAGRLTTASAKEFESLGLVKKGYAEYNKIGMIKRIKPGGIVGSEKDPLDWVYNVYLPALKAKGITDWNEIRKHLLIGFTNTDASFVTTLIAQMDKILSNIDINKKAKGVDETYNYVGGIPTGKMKDLRAAWETFSTSLGKMDTPLINKGIDAFIGVLQGLTYLVDKINNSHLWDSIEQKWDAFEKTDIGKELGKSVDAIASAGSAPSSDKKDNQAINLYVDGRLLATNQLGYFTEMLQLSHWSTPSQFNPSRSPTSSGATAGR